MRGIGQSKMNELKLAATTSTSISWRDELAYFHGAKSEGFAKLKEAIRLAKAKDSVADSASSDRSNAGQVKSAVAGD